MLAGRSCDDRGHEAEDVSLVKKNIVYKNAYGKLVNLMKFKVL